jgi:alpha-glucosidase
LLVAPVWQANQDQRALYLQEGSTWVHVWSGEAYSGGQKVTIAAPIGQPPVFYRSDAAFAVLFAALARL